MKVACHLCLLLLDEKNTGHILVNLMKAGMLIHRLHKVEAGGEPGCCGEFADPSQRGNH